MAVLEILLVFGVRSQVVLLSALIISQLSEGKGLSVLGRKPGQIVGQSIYELYADTPELLEAVKS